MLRAAIVFFILGLVAVVLGAYNFAGLSIEAGKIMLFAFLILAVVSFLASVLGGRNTTSAPLP